MKEKTKLSKIIALVVCLMLTITMFSSYSFASITEGTNTATITVKGLEAGVKVSAYQLTTVNYDYDNDVPQSTPYAWASDIQPLVQSINSSYTNMDSFVAAVNSSTLSEQFYDKLAAAIKAESISPKYTRTSGGTLTYPVTTNESVPFEDCEMGTYLILIENGYKVYTPLVVNLTPEFNQENSQWELKDQEATVKATNPTISKEIKNEGAITAKDPIQYEITGDVPKYLESSVSKKYYISDKISDSLTIDTGSIKVFGKKGGSETPLTGDGTDYTLTTESAQRPNGGDPVTFLINFVYDNIKDYEQVIVRYSATLKKDASIFEGELDLSNSAYLDYSNNPYEDGWQTSGPNPGEGDEGEEGGDKVTVYVYGADITNVDKQNKEIENGKAEFTLKSGADPLYFTKTADGTYFLANQGEGGASTTLVVGADGHLKILGLSTGTYTLTQTKAPEGYNKATSDTEIVIADSEPDGVVDGQEDAIYKANFQNSEGFQLPVTGGIGTTIFAACGIVFIGLGIVLLTASVKKNKNK